MRVKRYLAAVSAVAVFALTGLAGTAPAQTTNQTGLVNVSLTNTTIQVPIAAAVNLCGLNVAILAVLESTGPASCTAMSNSHAGGGG